MSDELAPRPRNQETDPRYNRESGIAIIQGSNYANEMQKFQQFPSAYGNEPGNPYVYRPFPKMVYRAQEWKGSVVCMAHPGHPDEYTTPDHYRMAEERAMRFTLSCQLTVNDERELQAAKENGYRESPAEAVECLKGKQLDRSLSAAHRNHEDRNMSEPAKREIAAAHEEIDGHVAEIPERPRQKRKYVRKVKQTVAEG